MDDQIAQFTAVTGANPEQAGQFLQLADNNIEQAITLYFEGGPLDLPGSASAPAAGSTAPIPGYREDDDGVVHIDSDSDDIMETDARPSFPPGGGMSDEELARQLAQEDEQEQSIRAPIARTTETLVGPGADWGSAEPDDMRAAVEEQLMRRSQPRRNQGRPGIFNQQGTNSVWDEQADGNSRRQNLSRATGGASETSSKASALAEMFRPPFELMSHVSWDHARDAGKANEKWLMVNIQDPAIFDCQVLNRDIWKNEGIKETIKEHFIFLQYNKDDSRIAQYIQYYFAAYESQNAYPHIAIVDPRTGEQVKTWSGSPPPKPMDFLMQLHEFLDRYSLKANARNPVAKRKPEASKEVDINRMTEDEMLEMALQNSMANSSSDGPKPHDPDALTREDKPPSPESKGKGKAPDTAPTETVVDSSFSQISSTKPHTEPTNDPATTTRMQFRYSGGRQIRRFALVDPVRRIYEWLKAEPIEGKQGHEFELIFMGKNLVDSLDSTIEEAGLKNGTIMIEFLDE